MEPTLLRSRKPLLWLALAGIGGIVLADRLPLPLPPLLAATVLSAVVAVAFKSRWICLLFTLLAFAALHTMRHVEAPAWRMAMELENAPRSVRGAGIVWSEPTAFVGSRGQLRANFWMKIERLEESGVPTRRGGLCLVRWSGGAPAYGDRIEIRGTAQVHDQPGNPGEFDTARWLQRQGVYFQIETGMESDCRITGHGAGNWARTFAIGARQWINERLTLGLPEDPETSALISSMVLGMRGDTPPEMKELFQKTGTLHLFAVSGLNVGMLAVIVWYVLKPLRIGRNRATFIIVPMLGAYAIVTGLSPSCVRASIMASIVLLAPLLERRASPVNGIAAAAFVILAWDTNQLFSPGFQLSFVIVLVIILLGSPIRSRVENLMRPDEFIPRRLWSACQNAGFAVWRIFAGAVGVTVSAWIGSLLFMAGYFHLISPSALVANFVAVPLAFVVLSLALFSLLASLASAPLTVIINHATWMSAKALLAAVAMFAKIPGGHVYVELPETAPEPVCEITVLEVGGGAAVHVRSGGGDWMVDAGHVRDYERTVLPYLRSRGVNRLDGVILTHGDSAHVGGAVPLLTDFAPLWIADTAGVDRSPVRRALHAEIAARGNGRRILQRGESVPLAGGVSIRVLYPPAGIERAQADDRALVLLLEAAGRRVLLTSDAGFFTEQWLLKNEPDIRADALVKGWAVRDFSGTPDFVAGVAPRVIVCTEQDFGVSPEALDAWAKPFQEKGVIVLPQARCGAVRVAVQRGGEMHVQTWQPMVPPM